MKKLHVLLTKTKVALDRWRKFDLRRWWAVKMAPRLHKPFEGSHCGRAWTSEEIGKIGEDLAAAWLAINGRKILKRNHKAAHGGEVDIVCRELDALCFVEVKTRTKVGWHRPADAVNQEKQKLIQRGARDWLKHLRRTDVGWRYDIMEVVLEDGQLPRMNCVVDAFKDSSANR
jgi:putative endonuclease